MYESPIEIRAIDAELTRFLDDAIMTEITQKYEIRVDKDELIKALKYDRGQYELGYIHGKYNYSGGISIPWTDESMARVIMGQTDILLPAIKAGIRVDYTWSRDQGFVTTLTRKDGVKLKCWFSLNEFWRMDTPVLVVRATLSKMVKGALE